MNDSLIIIIIAIKRAKRQRHIPMNVSIPCKGKNQNKKQGIVANVHTLYRQ